MTFELLTWISIEIIYPSRTISLPSLKLLGHSSLELSVAQDVEEWHDLWPTDLNITKDHLPIKDYLPTKFEASGAKLSLFICCTRLRDIEIPTNWQGKAICPSFFDLSFFINLSLLATEFVFTDGCLLCLFYDNSSFLQVSLTIFDWKWALRHETVFMF